MSNEQEGGCCQQEALRQKIELAAYYKWIDAGQPEGDNGEANWLTAEAELLNKQGSTCCNEVVESQQEPASAGGLSGVLAAGKQVLTSAKEKAAGGRKQPH